MLVCLRCGWLLVVYCLGVSGGLAVINRLSVVCYELFMPFDVVELRCCFS